MSEEIRQHLELMAERYEKHGMPPGEALCEAKKRFGGTDQIKERCRDERGFVWLGRLLNDIRFAVRSLCRAPGYTLTILFTLILGIGVTTLVFSLTEWTLLHASPFPGANQLFYLGSSGTQRPVGNFLPGIQVRAYQEQTNCFAEFATVEWNTSNVVIGGEPVVSRVLGVSVDCFHCLGFKLELGRGLLLEDFHGGAGDVAVISNLFWRQHFGGSPDVLGRTVLIDQKPYVVVGVLGTYQSFPPFFSGDLFRPLYWRVDPANPFVPNLCSIGRLKAGVSREQALAALGAVRLTGFPAWALPYLGDKPFLTSLSEMKRTDYSWIALVAAMLLYAIACLNAMNLMLIRLLGRRRELSIRLAVGGSRWQLVQLLAVETVGLALLASLAVVLAAHWFFHPLFDLVQGTPSQVHHNYTNWRTLTCIGGLSLVASLAILILPIFRLFKTEVNLGLRDGGPTTGESRDTGRIRNLLVLLQAAIAVMLLTGTGLMVRSFDRLHHLDLGFDPAGKIKVTVTFPKGYEMDPGQQVRLFDRLRQRLASIPGVRDVSYGQDALFVGIFPANVHMQLPDGTFRPVAQNAVSPDFQKTAGLLVKRGRWLSGKQGVFEAVINEFAARKLFGGRDPIGRPLRIKEFGDSVPFFVVGVVKDVRDSVRSPPGMHLYVPNWMSPGSIDSLLIRLDGDPKGGFSGQIRRAVYAVDPRLVVSNVTSIDDMVSNSVWYERYAYVILKGLAAIALGLTVVGIFSVIAYTVDRRTTEFGIRMALGATAADLHRLVFAQGLSFAFAGLVVGVAGSVGLTRFMESLLFETEPYDPVVYLGVSLVLMAAGTAACWLPARRAARLDVASLLRAD
jgi:putative ABC transport system permease protein